MEVTYHQLKEALIKSGHFYENDAMDIEYSGDGSYFESLIPDLLDAINEVLEETKD